MLDSNWEMINGAPAHHIEQLNAANTINVLEALVTLLLNNNQPNQLPLVPSETALRELHRCGTLFLLNRPGEYRDVPVQVINSQTGQVIYQAPPADQVAFLMAEFFKELGEIWISGDALDAAAFALDGYFRLSTRREKGRDRRLPANANGGVERRAVVTLPIHALKGIVEAHFIDPGA